MLTSAKIAEKLSKGLGRKIANVKLTKEDSVKKWMASGTPEPTAQFMATLETMTAAGTEERMNDVVEKVTGRPPQTFDSFVQENKSAWN
jgi:hypothetical protein